LGIMAVLKKYMKANFKICSTLAVTSCTQVNVKI